MKTSIHLHSIAKALGVSASNPSGSETQAKWLENALNRAAQHNAPRARIRCAPANRSVIALLLGIAATAPQAQAANCGINSVSPVAFGIYTPSSGTPKDTMGSVTYQCSIAGALETMTLFLSTGNSGSYVTRKMLSGSHELQYNLYLDAGRNFVWGNGSGTTVVWGPTILNLFPITVNIYGRIPALQPVIPGSYTDTVVITAMF